MRRLRPIFDPKKPTALFLGRAISRSHEGHKALIVEGIRRVGQACIAVRNTQGIDEKTPFDFEYVRARIEHGLREYQGRFVVVPVPNISATSSTAATSATRSSASSWIPRIEGVSRATEARRSSRKAPAERCGILKKSEATCRALVPR